MGSMTPLEMLEDDGRLARARLTAYRSRLYRYNHSSPMAADIRLREPERRWRGTAERLNRARMRTP